MNMIEIKNTDFENLYIGEIINDVLEKHEIINKIIYDEYGFKVKCHPYGAAYLANIRYKGKSYYHNDGYGISNKNSMNIRLGYTGSYHFWITLPYSRDDIHKDELIEQGQEDLDFSSVQKLFK